MQRLISFMTVGLLLVLLSANELFALAPSTQASNIAFSNVTANSVRVVFTRGDGDSRILVFRAGSSTPANPTDGQAYSGATSNFNSSPANTAAGSIVVYQGTSRAINVSGLTAGTEYTVKVYERNGTDYLLLDASANPRSFFTNPAPPATIGAGAHNATHTQFDANWTDPASGGWDGFQITVSTVNTFASALNWYSNMELGDVNTLLVEDINTAPADDILPNTVYYYRVRTMQDSRLSAWASYTAGVTTLPENPTVSPVTATICYGETHIVIPTAPNPGNGVEQNKFYAYDAVTGGNRVWGYPLLEIDLTPLTPGTHNYWIATVSNKTGLESAARVQVTVTAYAPGPVADAGDDQVLCDYGEGPSPTLDANDANPTNLVENPPVGTWTQISGPTTVTFDDVYSATTAVYSLDYGTYVFRWTITQNSCATTYDEMSLTWTESPTMAAAGLDIDICGSLSTTLSANTPSAGTGLWSYTTNGTGTLSFSPSASDPNATVTATEAGVYQLVWTISNGICEPSIDEVVVTFDATPTTAAAGTDIDQCGTTSVNLLANTPVVGTGFWSQFSGPSTYTATFGDENDPETSVSIGAGEEGTYTFRWTIESPFGVCADSYDDVVVTWSPEISEATLGTATSIGCGDLSVELWAVYPSVGDGEWSLISGPSGASFEDPTLSNSYFYATTYGSYTLRWTVSDPNGICPDDYVETTVAFAETPTAANAGFDFDVCGLSSSFAGNSPAVGTGLWTMASGPGDETIANSGLYNSGISVSDYGSYSFEWTITSGCATSSDFVQVTFWDNLNSGNNVWTAGDDKSICGVGSLNTATLNGKNPADYSPSTPYGEWTKVSGPGVPTFDDWNEYNTTVYFNLTGTYVLRWTGFNGPCTQEDEITVVVAAQPTVTFGAIGPFCNTQSSVALTTGSPANGTYSGTGVTAGSFYPSNVGAGTYTLTYTYEFGGCSTAATRVVTVNAPTTIEWTTVYDAACLNGSAITLTGDATPSGGTYTGAGVISGNSFNPSSAGVGTHTITYTYNDGVCTSTATNTIVVNPLPVVTWTGDLGAYCVTDVAGYALTGVNPTGGTFSGAGVSGSDFYASNAGVGTHTLTYTYTDGNGCINTATNTVEVLSEIVATFAAVEPVCYGSQAFDLNQYVSPSGGVFTGTGVSGTDFDPTGLSAGTYTLTYTVTSGSCSDVATSVVTIKPLPVIISAGEFGAICEDGNSFNLITVGSPNPATGTYTGAGVFSGTMFDPSSVTPGVITLTYTVIEDGCSTSSDVTITVDEKPVVTWTAEYGPYCETVSTPVALNASTSVGSGSYSGTGVSGTDFIPSLAGPGVHTITYTAVNGTCTTYVEKYITVDEEPVITWTANYGPYCETVSTPVSLNASTSVGSGSYTGTGLSGSSFIPSIAGPGVHTITYTAVNGTCTTFVEKYITVDEEPVITWTEAFLSSICEDTAPFALNASTSVGSGSYTGTGIVSGNYFDPAGLGDGVYTITYTAVNGACTTYVEKSITVDEKPAAEWIFEGAEVCAGSEDINIEGFIPAELNPIPYQYDYSSSSPEYLDGTWFSPTVAGTYTVTLTITNGACTTYVEREIIVNPLPTVTWTNTLGQICETGNPLTLEGGMPTGGSYSGSGVFSGVFDPSSAGVGTYTLTYTYTDGNGCVNTATNTIEVNAEVFASAGDDDDAVEGEYTYDFLAETPSVGTGTWTKFSGPGTASFADANDPETTVTVSAYGEYEFIWTSTNGACESSDNVVITFTSSATAATKLAITVPANVVHGQSFTATIKTLNVANNEVAPDVAVNFTLSKTFGNSSLTGTLTGTITPPASSATVTITLTSTDEKVGEAGVELTVVDDATLLTDGVTTTNVLPIVPPDQATGLAFTGKSTSSLSFVWDKNGADGVVIIGRKNSLTVPSSFQLQGGTAYTGSASWGAGHMFSSTTYGVYNGSGSSLTVTGLSSVTNYGFKVFAYYGTGTLINYNNTNRADWSNNKGTPTEKNTFDAEELPLIGDNILSSSYVTPNPARDNVSLAIDLAKSASLSISFYTADGKEVVVAVDNTMFSAGRHNFNIPLNGLAAGVYSVIIRADNEFIINNVVVMP